MTYKIFVVVYICFVVVYICVVVAALLWAWSDDGQSTFMRKFKAWRKK